MIQFRPNQQFLFKIDFQCNCNCSEISTPLSLSGYFYAIRRFGHIVVQFHCKAIYSESTRTPGVGFHKRISVCCRLLIVTSFLLQSVSNLEWIGQSKMTKFESLIQLHKCSLEMYVCSWRIHSIYYACLWDKRSSPYLLNMMAFGRITHSPTHKISSTITYNHVQKQSS